MAWLTRIGARVWVTLAHSPDADMIAELQGRLLRVQVKTSSSRQADRWKVSIATRGGNQSWAGTVKHFHRSRCDFLFVWVSGGRKWFIPSTAVDGATGLCLGGPKYSEYEVSDSGALPEAVERALECATPRGSAVVGETGRSVKSVAQPEWVRLPPPPLRPTKDARPQPVKRRSHGRSRLSSGHQMTVPIGPFRVAQLAPGDQFEVVATGPGEIRLSRVHAAISTVPASASASPLTPPAAPEPEGGA